MTRVKFSTKQQPVKYYLSSENKYYIFICLNEEEIDEKESYQDDTGYETVHYFVYDYEEIIVDKTEIDIEDVLENPDNYINYKLLEYKKQKVSESKEILTDYLLKHPIKSSCHGNKEALYSITEEKQSLMVRALLIYKSKVEAGIDAELKWNSTGNECEAWTIDEFKQLMLEIDGVVTPLVAAQQKYEKDIMSCNSKCDVDDILLEYNTK